MIRKKLWALVMVATMAAGTLSGCGQSEENQTTSGKTEVENKGQTETESAGDESVELKKVRCLAIDHALADAAGNTVTFSDWVEGDSVMWDKLTSDLAECGIELELDLIPEDQFSTTIQTKIVAGLDDYDWVWLGDGVDQQTIDNMIETGQILNVKDVMALGDGTAEEYYATGTGYDIMKNKMDKEGNFYTIYAGAAGSYKGKWSGMAIALMIRQDWLDKLGLPQPETMDELYNTLVAFQENDMNGNGLKDEVLNIWNWCIGNGVSMGFGLAPSFGTSIIGFDMETGKHVHPYYQENCKEYYAFMNKLYNEGLIALNEGSLLVENKSAAMNGTAQVATEEGKVVVPEGEKAAQYVWIVPKDDSTDRIAHWGGVGPAPSADCACIPAGADKEAVAKLLDYISTDEFSTFAQHGIEGYTYDTVDGKIVARADSDISEVTLMASFFAPWDKCLPSFQPADYSDSFPAVLEAGKALGYEDGFVEKTEALYRIMDNIDNYHSYIGIWSSPDAEAQARIDELMPDLSTYMGELNDNLITGNWSLDNWDEYMAELKKLGLDEVLAIYDEFVNKL